MSEEPFTNRELKNMFRGIDEKLDSHGQVHGEILGQVKYTNGRVRFLEKMIWLAMGGLAVLSFFFSQQRLDLANSSLSQKEIDKSVAQAFETYLELNGYNE